MRIQPRGNPSSQVWVVTSKPSEKDLTKGFIFSDTMGWLFDQMWKEAGFKTQPFVIALSPDLDKPLSEEDQLAEFKYMAFIHKPPIIIPFGYDATGLLCPETVSTRSKKIKKVSLEKYAGSILTSPYLSWLHYCIPTYSMDYICADWSYRDICVSIDLGRAAEELAFYENNKKLQPLPEYNMEIAPTYEKLCGILEGYLSEYKLHNILYLSTDIETIRPVKTSQYKGNPGFPYTISFAPNATNAVSFSIWDYPAYQGCRIWRLLEEILQSVPQIGQNYFSFDAHYLKALGFHRICLDKCQDTKLRHHMLWPELPHKLQFLCKQYTRQKFYKEEGRGWTPKHKDKLMRYNCIDTCVTYEVFQKQEEEFNERPYLK